MLPSYSRTISHTIGWKDISTGDRHERRSETDVRRHRVSGEAATLFVCTLLYCSVTFYSQSPFRAAVLLACGTIFRSAHRPPVVLGTQHLIFPTYTLLYI